MRRIAAGIAAALACSTLAACGSSSGKAELTWYINPDGGGSDPNGGGQAQLAKECSTDTYSISVQLLPNSASDQRTQLLRRLAAGDSSMDLMSVDPVYVPEFAEAGYLAPVPSDMESTFTQDRVASALTAAKWNDKLVAVPFWANTQLLWYRKSVAEKAGLDMSKPVTWDQLIAAAQKTNTDIGVQAMLYEGYTVWINALIAGAGGEIVKNPGATYDDLELGLDSDAGRKAAAIIAKISQTKTGGPSMGSSDETAALNLFENKSSSGFLVNWPYVYAALQTAGADGGPVDFMDDVGATLYPQTVAGTESAPPFGGIDLAVGAKSSHIDEAYQAAACITSADHQAEYMIGTGNPASDKTVFDRAEVKKAFPNGIAALIRKSLDRAVPRPQSQYYGDISTGLQQKFSPPSSVNQNTPATAQKFLIDVLNGKALL
ncbi:MAG: extracellular solute-binding protein [Nocardioides sp.]|uniref:extracellular solute-binding protein n=1 Tax=Nocardioides sp. TaxID=35761 RepID=UPI0039E70852